MSRIERLENVRTVSGKLCCQKGPTYVPRYTNGSNTTRAERGADRGAHHIDMIVAMIDIGKKPK